MIRTDFHAHAFPPGMVPERIHRARALSRAIHFGRDRGTYVDELVARMKENIDDPQADRIRKDLEAAGIERAALIGIDWGLVGGNDTELAPEAQQEWAREVAARHAGFFRVLYGLDPRRPNAGTLAGNALAGGHVAGIKLYPPAGFSPADPICDPIYQAVVDAGAIAMFHTGRQTYPFDIAYGRLEFYGAVQRRFPSMKLVLGHAGRPFWGGEALEIASGHPTTWIEISNWNHNVATDLPRVQRFLRLAWRLLGPARVLFGSDAFSGRRGPSDDITHWKEIVESTAADAGVELAATERGVDELLEQS